MEGVCLEDLRDTELAGAMQIFVHVNSEYLTVIRINRNSKHSVGAERRNINMSSSCKFVIRWFKEKLFHGLGGPDKCGAQSGCRIKQGHAQYRLANVC